MPRSADDQYSRVLAALDIAAQLKDKTAERRQLDVENVQTEALGLIALELREMRILMADGTTVFPSNALTDAIGEAVAHGVRAARNGR